MSTPLAKSAGVSVEDGFKQVGGRIELLGRPKRYLIFSGRSVGRESWMPVIGSIGLTRATRPFSELIELTVKIFLTGYNRVDHTRNYPQPVVTSCEEMRYSDRLNCYPNEQ